jgi:hypothetical protein
LRLLSHHLLHHLHELLLLCIGSLLSRVGGRIFICHHSFIHLLLHCSVLLGLLGG